MVLIKLRINVSLFWKIISETTPYDYLFRLSCRWKAPASTYFSYLNVGYFSIRFKHYNSQKHVYD